MEITPVAAVICFAVVVALGLIISYFDRKTKAVKPKDEEKDTVTSNNDKSNTVKKGKK